MFKIRNVLYNHPVVLCWKMFQLKEAAKLTLNNSFEDFTDGEHRGVTLEKKKPTATYISELLLSLDVGIACLMGLE